MRQAAAAEPVGITGWAIRAVLVVTRRLRRGVYVVSTLPGVRSTPGFDPA